MSALDRFRPRAAIFDLDGTLVDNMAWHTQAFDVFLARRGREPLSMAWRHRIDGKRNSEIFPLLFGREMTGDEIRACEDEKEGLYRELSRKGLAPLDGTAALLDALASADVRIAVATSAPAENVTHTLREIGLTDRFPIIARGDQVARGKPAPDVFLHAAKLLDVPPETCLAFEDAPLGVTAAKAAGMRCVALTTSFARETFLAGEPPPDATCTDFADFLATAGRALGAPAI